MTMPMTPPLDLASAFAPWSGTEGHGTPITTGSTFIALRHRAPRMSVVVIARRRPALLARCLDALLAQSLPGAAFEIVVVDVGHDAATHRVVEAAADHARRADGPDLRYYDSRAPLGPAGARNRGWRLARADVVAFTDDDAVPDREWLRAGEDAFHDASVVAARGRVQATSEFAPDDDATLVAPPQPTSFATASAFVRRHALIAIGGFDERFTQAPSDAADLFLSLVEHYGDDAIAPTPAALVRHPTPPFRFGDALARQRERESESLLHAKHPTAGERFLGSRSMPSLHAVVVGACALALVVAPELPGPALALASAAAGLCLGLAAVRLRGAPKTPRRIADAVLTSFALPFVSLWWRLVGAWRWRTARVA